MDRIFGAEVDAPQASFTPICEYHFIRDENVPGRAAGNYRLAACAPQKQELCSHLITSLRENHPARTMSSVANNHQRSSA